MHSPHDEDVHQWELLDPQQHSQPSNDSALSSFLTHYKGQSVSTDLVITNTLRQKYPSAHITSTPTSTPGSSTLVDLLAYARSGHAQATPLDDPNDLFPAVLRTRNFRPAAKRLDGGSGSMVETVQFGRYKYEWQGNTWLMYYVMCREMPGYPAQINVHFLLSGNGVKFADGSVGHGHGETPQVGTTVFKMTSIPTGNANAIAIATPRRT